MNATGTSTWNGTWHDGSGTISTTSKALNGAPYTYGSRFEEPGGTGPEELLAAAHASCFNQALAHNLDRQGFDTGAVQTSVRIDYGIDDGRPTIYNSHITVVADVVGCTEDEFADVAAASASGCSISRILTCLVTIDARLSA